MRSGEIQDAQARQRRRESRSNQQRGSGQSAPPPPPPPPPPPLFCCAAARVLGVSERGTDLVAAAEQNVAAAIGAVDHGEEG